MPDPLSGDRPLRLVVIGAGKMGRAHLAALSRMEDVEVTGVASRSGTSARRLADEHGVAEADSDWEALVRRTGAEACVVAVSHSENARVTRATIERGLHVLAEKPVAFDSGTVLELAELARKKNVVALAAMNRRFFPHMALAADFVRFRGPLRTIRLNAPDSSAWRRRSARLDAFVYDRWLVANTLHAFDLLRLFGGEVEEVTGYGRVDRDDWVIGAALRFDSGAVGVVTSDSDRTRIHLPWEMELKTDGASAVLSPLEELQLHVGRGRFAGQPHPEADGLKPGLWFQLRAFVEGIHSPAGLDPVASDLADHARSVELVERLSLLPPPAA